MLNAVNEYLALQIGHGTPVSLTHDDNGNLTVDPTAWNVDDTTGPSGQAYTFDEENRLTEVDRHASPGDPLAEYTYDALGRRIESVDYTPLYDPNSPNGCGAGQQPVVTRHIYAGLESIEEYVLCGTAAPGCGDDCDEWILAREFIWGDRFPEPLAMIDHTGCGTDTTGGVSPGPGCGGGETFGGSVGAGPWVYHYIHDALGSVVGLTDEDGVVVEYYTYDPYGETYIEDPTTGARRTASAYANPFMWTAQRYDAGVKLYHFAFRSYSPRHGRWLQRDPLGYVDGVNIYQYCRSEPTFYIDPLGLKPETGLAGDAFGEMRRLRSYNSTAEGEMSLAIEAGCTAAFGIIKTAVAAYGLMVPDITDFALFLGSRGVKIVGGEIVDKFGKAIRKADIDELLSQYNIKMFDDWLNSILDKATKTKTTPKIKKGVEGTLTQYDASGGFKQAKKEFDALVQKSGKKPVKKQTNNDSIIVWVLELDDGTTVVVRNTSSSGKPTLEIQSPPGVCEEIKIRY